MPAGLFIPNAPGPVRAAVMSSVAPGSERRSVVVSNVTGGRLMVNGHRMPQGVTGYGLAELSVELAFLVSPEATRNPEIELDTCRCDLHIRLTIQ